jgi:uncharacterized membrane protein YhaH (DUF805 family)
MENPYQAPKSDVADVNRDEAYQPVRIFSTSGRIGRVRFIAYTFGLSFLCSIVAGILAAAIGGMGGVVLIVNWLVILVLSLMLSIQRAHDFNASGWLGILGLIPLVNLIFWFVPGTDGPNRFGHKTPPNSWGTVAAACVIPVVFVIGIVAAVALPAYQDYAKRTAAQKAR